MELPFVHPFEHGLVRSKEGTLGIIHQAEGPFRSAIAEPQVIELLECGYNFLERAAATHTIDVVFEIIRERGDKLHTVITVKLGKAFHTVLEKDREVGAHYYM